MGRVRLERPSARRERDFIDAALRSRALHRGLVTAAATGAEYREYLDRTRRGRGDASSGPRALLRERAQRYPG